MIVVSDEIFLRIDPDQDRHSLNNYVKKMSLTLCQSVKKCHKIMKICQITNIDMGFQKKDISSRSEQVDFFEQVAFS